MPEGDTYARSAVRLRSLLAGQTLTALDGNGGIRRSSARLNEATVTGVRTIGKHILIDFDSGWTIHIQLGMSGRWQFDRPASSHDASRAVSGGDSRRRTPTLLLETSRGAARCFDAPNVEVDRTEAIQGRLRGLGPDLLGPDLLGDGFDLAEIGSRWRHLPVNTPVCDALLNQRVMAGIGNVYKNEILFLERVHPLTPAGHIDDKQVRALADRARRLLAANATRSGPRNTGAGAGTWVYRRGGRPCRRCGTPIVSERLGAGLRSTYWCPSCQPRPDPSSP